MMVKTITFGISEELHTRFKNFCTNKNINMKDALVLAIQIIINKKDLKK